MGAGSHTGSEEGCNPDGTGINIGAARLAVKDELDHREFWSGRWESNPRPKLGKLLYCHCTTPAQKLTLANLRDACKNSSPANSSASAGPWIPFAGMLELRLSYFVIMIAFDASTLILIAEIELLDIFLGAIKLKAAIPEEVARECYGAKKTLDALMIQKALDKSRMKVVAVKNKKLVAKLSADFSLGRGEAEAITLALK